MPAGKIQTHQRIDTVLCGQPVSVGEGSSRVVMTTVEQMAVDASGLTHGGFIFGLADHAAMIAVNHPNVVLGAAEVKFLKPVKTGDLLTAEATVTTQAGKKQTVSVTVNRQEEAVFRGQFICFILDQHVLA